MLSILCLCIFDNLRFYAVHTSGQVNSTTNMFQWHLNQHSESLVRGALRSNWASRYQLASSRLRAVGPRILMPIQLLRAASESDEGGGWPTLTQCERHHGGDRSAVPLL